MRKVKTSSAIWGKENRKGKRTRYTNVHRNVLEDFGKKMNWVPCRGTTGNYGCERLQRGLRLRRTGGSIRVHRGWCRPRSCSMGRHSPTDLSKQCAAESTQRRLSKLPPQAW